MVDVDAAADGCGDGREIAFVGADDEVVAAQGTFDDAGVDDVGGAGAADQGSGGPGVVESFGTARRQSLKLIHHLADGQAGARSPGRTAIQTGAAEPVRHGELYGIAPKWCERVTGVKDHSLAVQRFSSASDPGGLFTSRGGADGADWVHLRRGRPPAPCPGVAVGEEARQPARGYGMEVFPGLAHRAGEDWCYAAPGAAVCRGGEEVPWMVSCSRMTALSLSLRGFAKR